MRAGHRAHRGGDFQKHAGSNIGIALFDVRRGGPGGSRDHRDQRSSHGIVQVDAEQQRESGSHHDAPAQARERAKKSRERGQPVDHARELEGVQRGKQHRSKSTRRDCLPNVTTESRRRRSPDVRSRPKGGAPSPRTGSASV